jgi:hypothetical protein
MFYKVVLVFFAFALFALTFTILVLIRLLPALFIWRLLVACETIFVLRVSVIICFNYSKIKHKFCVCPKPQKPGIIHKIKEKDSDINVIDIINKDLGKE